MISINTNTGSLYARQAMSLNDRGFSKAMEELSTGKQINNATDNVAGMAISTGMAAQIRGLNQAVRNANDGISVLTTADSALVQISNMLQRMRDLSARSINDTNSIEDRNYVNLEFQQLKTQISKISSSTQWNGIDVLNGVVGSDWEGKFSFQVGSNVDQAVGIQLLNLEQAPPIYVTGGNNQAKAFSFKSGLSYPYDPSVDDPYPNQFAGFGLDPNIPNTIGSAFGKKLSLSINGEVAASVTINDPQYFLDIGGTYYDPTASPAPAYPPGTELSTTMMNLLVTDFNTKNAAKTVDGDHFVAAFDASTHKLTIGYAHPETHPSDATIADDNFAVTLSSVDGWANAQVPPQQRFDLSVYDVGNLTSLTAQDQMDRRIVATFGAGGQQVQVSYTVTQADIDLVSNGTKLSQTVADGLANQLRNHTSGQFASMGLQADNSSEHGVLSVDWATPSQAAITGSVVVQGFLPLSTADITTGVNASYALSNVDSAMEVLNLQRAKIGASMSTLQSVSDNLSVMSAKTQEARSRIEDTEYSQATTNFAKRAIIKQAAEAMLAQANQVPQLVLLLLKSN